MSVESSTPPASPSPVPPIQTPTNSTSTAASGSTLVQSQAASSPSAATTSQVRVASQPVAQKPRLLITKAPRLGRQKTDWKNLGLTVAFSAVLHALALIACTFIVFTNPGLLEDIFTQVREDQDPDQDDPIVEQTLVQPDDIDKSSQDSDVTTVAASEMLFEKGLANLNISDLPPAQVKVEAGDLPGLPDIKFDNAASGRMSSAAKQAMVRHFGGNSASEAAVASGMKWLAKHQFADGSWSMNHSTHPDCNGQCSQGAMVEGKPFESRMAATGLALLAFLGGGHTHQSGDYQKEVKGGIDYLLKNGKVTPQGYDLCPIVVSNEKMYTQGICTIALAESAALTKDPRVRQAATGAVHFIAAAQHPKSGGWRYNPYSAGYQDTGDTSVVGWQIMALKSCQNAKLKFSPASLKGAETYLNAAQVEGGAKYVYDLNQKAPTDSMTAAGLLCRMYLGWDRKNKILQEGVAYLDKKGPNLNEMYYNYYATQVMHHWGGDEWTRWNERQRDHLVRTQQTLKDGHLAGSWNKAVVDHERGGRHFMTCLTTMTLEVYYRHLPIYRREGLKVEF